MVLSIGRHRFSGFQVLVHAASWLPLVWVFLTYQLDPIKVNPIQTITQQTGRIALIWFLLSLACTPTVTLLGFNPALKVRRALGLYAFFYAVLHFLIFSVLDYRLDLPQIFDLLISKRYLIAGTFALLILIALAVTSTQQSMRTLGKAWRRLHQLAYPGAVLVILHYLWAAKAGTPGPYLYAAALFVLLLLRVPPVRRWISAHKPTWMRQIGQRLAGPASK
ncbi:MAG: sulfoxide reductase heme-binding subunit YedZ [Chloroflexi bacterium]|nr:sulfoxide reductase heme-binding subunit YedZ [Chloroflexota bacterium]